LSEVQRTELYHAYKAVRIDRGGKDVTHLTEVSDKCKYLYDWKPSGKKTLRRWVRRWNRNGGKCIVSDESRGKKAKLSPEGMRHVSWTLHSEQKSVRGASMDLFEGSSGWDEFVSYSTIRRIAFASDLRPSQPKTRRVRTYTQHHMAQRMFSAMEDLNE